MHCIDGDGSAIDHWRHSLRWFANGLPMVLQSPCQRLQWFAMVYQWFTQRHQWYTNGLPIVSDHWSNNGIVSMDCTGLRSNCVSMDCTGLRSNCVSLKPYDWSSTQVPRKVWNPMKSLVLHPETFLQISNLIGLEKQRKINHFKTTNALHFESSCGFTPVRKELFLGPPLPLMEWSRQRHQWFTMVYNGLPIFYQRLQWFIRSNFRNGL